VVLYGQKMEGSPLDLRDLYAAHSRLVWWAVRACGVHEAAVEDVVQEVFIAVHRRRHAAPSDDVRPWLVGVARSVSYSFRRSADRRQRRAHALGSPSATPPPDEIVAAQQAWRALQGFLAELPDVQREAFVLVDLQGLPVVEAAQALGTNLNTLYSRLRLARAKFTSAFEDVRGVAVQGRRGGNPDAKARRRVWMLVAVRVGSEAGIGAGTAAATAWSLPLSLVLAGTATWLVIRDRPAASAVPTIAASPDPQVRTRGEPPSNVPDLPDTRTALAQSEAPSPIAPMPPAPASAAPAGARRASPRPPRSDPPREPTPDVLADPLQEESRLLTSAAQDLDAGRVGSAAALLSEHARRFPAGALAPERERLEDQLSRLRAR
jgi:RNA polymerase sigma-70 factor (ECF subfamily)